MPVKFLLKLKSLGAQWTISWNDHILLKLLRRDLELQEPLSFFKHECSHYIILLIYIAFNICINVLIYFMVHTLCVRHSQLPAYH